MKFRAMAVAAAVLTGSMAAVPAPAAAPITPTAPITTAPTHAGGFAGTPDDPFTFAAPPAGIAPVLTVVDDGRQVVPTSFAGVADGWYALIAPLTFAVDAGEGAATTIPVATGRGTIVVRHRAAGTLNAAAGDASILPEAATWAMMLIGFGMVGFGMRCGIRRSNAKFDLKVQRIAAGLEA